MKIWSHTKRFRFVSGQVRGGENSDQRLGKGQSPSWWRRIGQTHKHTIHVLSAQQKNMYKPTFLRKTIIVLLPVQSLNDERKKKIKLLSALNCFNELRKMAPSMEEHLSLLHLKLLTMQHKPHESSKADRYARGLASLWVFLFLIKPLYTFRPFFFFFSKHSLLSFNSIQTGC